MIATLRNHLSRLRSYHRRFGAWRTVRRLVAGLLGRAPAPIEPVIEPPPAAAVAEAAPDSTLAPPSTEAPVAAPPPGATDAAPALEPPAPPARPPWSPLHVFHTPARGRKRLTVIVDTMAGSAVPDGVGITILLGTLLAERSGADLRLVTRAEPPQPVLLHPLLQACGVVPSGDIQCRYLPVSDARAELDLVDGEWLITDAWWNTAAALAAVEPARVVYLLQADERRSDAGEEEGLRFDMLLRRSDLQCVIGGAALRQHLVREGFDHFETQALTFEPASLRDPQHAAAWPAALEPVLAPLAARI